VKVNAPDEAVGKRIRCKCGTAISVPGVATVKSAAPAGKPPSGANAPLSPSLFDVLTDRDRQMAQTNPYATTEKSTTNDATALRTYLRDDEAKETKAKQSKSNLLLITACFFLGALKNIAAIAIALALPDELPNAAAATPFLKLKSLYLAVLIPYALFDFAAGIGMTQRKAWGWWLAVVGMGWAVAERVGSWVVVFLTSEEVSFSIGAAIGTLIFGGICAALIGFMLQSETQKRFGVTTKPAIAWLAIVLIPLVIEGGVTAGLFAALKSALANP
jgi:hypothetical protein